MTIQHKRSGKLVVRVVSWLDLAVAEGILIKRRVQTFFWPFVTIARRTPDGIWFNNLPRFRLGRK